MTSFASLLIPCLLLASAAASAQTAYQSRQLPPGSWDVRAGLEADGLLNHAGGGLAVETGLFPLGAGVLAAGLEAGFNRCLLGCGSGDGLLVDRTALTPMARLAWHFPVGADTANVTEVNLYAVVVAGASFTFQTAENGGFSVERNQVVPLAGAGIGSLYFPGSGDTVFAGGELRLLYAPSTRAALTAGVPLTPWSLAGVRLAFTMGVRL